MTCSVNHETITTKFCSICGAPKGSAATAPVAPQWNAPLAPAWNPPAQQYAPTQNYQPQYGQPQYGQQQGTNGLAIAGFVTSLVCLGPIGFILSLVGLNQIKKDPSQEGKGLAIAGAIIGGITTIGLIIYLFVVLIILADYGYY